LSTGVGYTRWAEESMQPESKTYAKMHDVFKNCDLRGYSTFTQLYFTINMVVEKQQANE